MFDSIDESYKKLFDSGCVDEIYKDSHSGTLIQGPWVMCYDIDNYTATMFVFYKDILVYVLGDEIDYIAYGEDVNVIYNLLFSALAFIKHAKIETKELKPGKKETFSNDKWINNTRQSITVVDSLWFTNLVKSGAFNVRGHFRLQPYKDRKELIWISEFEKQGYTRKAKKLSFYPDEENEQLQPASL